MERERERGGSEVVRGREEKELRSHPGRCGWREERYPGRRGWRGERYPGRCVWREER